MVAGSYLLLVLFVGVSIGLLKNPVLELITTTSLSGIPLI